MNNKVLAILAASATILGSIISAAPAHAASADLPVEIKVEPYIYLRTYDKLKFVVTQQNLGGQSLDQTAGTYDEANKTPLNQVAPNPTTVLGSGQSVTKTVDPLYIVWGAPGTSVNISVTPSGTTLVGSGPFPTTAQMSVTAGGTQTSIALNPTTPYKGMVDVKFDFASAPSPGNYTGGMLTISATTP